VILRTHPDLDQPTTPYNRTEGNMMQRESVTKQLRETARSAVETVMTAVTVLRAYISARLAPVMGDERGEIASWVVVTALVIVAAIAIVGIVVTKLTATANNIQTP
jgi:hypothetical protein